MDIKFLGDAIKFGMELETMAACVLEDMSRDAATVEVKKALMTVLDMTKKRKEYLQKLYNDNIYSDMDTGVFEPIGLIDSALYLPQDELSKEERYPNMILKALEIEEKTRDFYLTLATSLKSRRKEVSRIFGKMAQENSDLQLKLKSIYEVFQL